jgi:hypothetical protein
MMPMASLKRLLVRRVSILHLMGVFSSLAFTASGLHGAEITQKAGGGSFVEGADLIHKAECAATRPEMSRALSPLW